mgnify:CR=1 FL=1
MKLVQAFAQLPNRFLMACGRGIGALLWHVGSLRRVALGKMNIAYPQLSVAERTALARLHCIQAGQGLFELFIALWGSHARIARLSQQAQWEGLEHFAAAQATGRGIIVLTPHTTAIVIGARLLTQRMALHAMYRPMDNPVLDHIFHSTATRYLRGLIPHHSVKTMVAQLQAGDAICYLPDQARSGKYSIQAPFFGAPALTLTSPGRLAQETNAIVLPFFCIRVAPGVYRQRFLPPLENYPSGDDLADATRINRLIEEQLADEPSQYLWLHKRYKGTDAAAAYKRKETFAKRHERSSG